MTFVKERSELPTKVYSLGMAVHVVCQDCGAHLGVKAYPNRSTYLSEIDPEIRESIPNNGQSQSCQNFMGIGLSVAPCKTCIEKETGPARALKAALVAIAKEPKP